MIDPNNPLGQIQAPRGQFVSIPQKQGGMFGGGHNWASVLAAALAGGAGNNNLVGAVLDNLQAKQKAALEDQQYQRERADKQTDWRSQYDYELAHPKPINNDTANDYSFWQQHLSPDQFQQWVQKQYDPDVSIPLPDGRMYVGPRSGMAAAMGGGQSAPKPVGNLRDYNPGGAGSNVGGNFPR